MQKQWKHFTTQSLHKRMQERETSFPYRVSTLSSDQKKQPKPSASHQEWMSGENRSNLIDTLETKWMKSIPRQI